MAKKKTAETANIKAAPVLRSGGDDPTPETPVITKSYSVRDDWKDINKVNYVAFKSVDGEVQDLTVNGEPAGGGGGATATVKFASEPTVFKTALPVLKNGTYTNTNGGAIDETTTFPVDLTIPIPAKGIWNGDDAPTCTGGISYNADTYELTVTGDGTITK